MTNKLENCTENVLENNGDIRAAEKSEHFNENETKRQNPPKLYYLIQVEGEHEFRLTAKSARKKGVKAEFCPAGWVYQDKKEAEWVANRWSQGKRKLHVVNWYEPLLDVIWNGSKDKAKLAKKTLRNDASRDQVNKKKQQIIEQCYLKQSGFHPSWLYADPEIVPEDLKKEYEYFKPLWDKAIEKESEIDLRAADIAREEEDIEEVIPDFVSDFNKKHAVIHHGKTHILSEKYDPVMKRDSFSLEPIASFNAWNKPKKDKNGKQLSEQWLSHPARREYHGGIIFDPEHPGHHNGYYNLFQGYSVIPKEGDCSLFWKLLHEILCSGDKHSSTYIRRWLSHLIQRPWELPETAIAMRGLQGTGKGTFMRYVSRLVSRYYLELAQMNQVVGRFNSHMKDVILVYANEAVWGGNKSEVGALKALITDPIQAIEQKNVDIISVRNCKRLVLSSNENWIVPRDIDDRRFLICDVDPKYKEDKEFFKQIVNQMDNGGLEALMYDLINEPINGWHPRNDMPGSPGAFDLKIKNMESSHRWLYDCLLKERYTVEIDSDNWKNTPQELGKDNIYRDYEFFCERKKIKAEDERIFWKKIIEILGKFDERRLGEDYTGKRQRVVAMPSLKEAKMLFSKFAKEESSTLWDL